MSMLQRALIKRTKATILYATETGKAKTLAHMLHKLFTYAFNSKVRFGQQFISL